MTSTISHRPAVTVTAIPAEPLDDASLAAASAQERYTAARRKYTGLYVEFKSTGYPDRNLAAALDAARTEALALAGALRRVEDGDPEAIRTELEAAQVTDSERARTTDRFTIAELHRAAAAAAPASWNWQR